jgi:CRP-like cAMP-binding protein
MTLPGNNDRLTDERHVPGSGPFKNAVLNALGAEVTARLHLRPVTFELEHEIEFPGNTIDHLYFLEEGMASMTTTFRDGSQVEVGMFGYKSVIGVSALMGSKRSLNRVYTQIAGSGFAAPMERARTEFALGGAFQKMALGYVQAQLVQVIQLAGCNATHTFEQRLARWLLICADRAQCDTFHMSHEYMSEMLGSTRSTLSLAAAQLKHDGIIEYTRGIVHIRSLDGLKNKACECYAVVENHLDNFLEYDGGIPPQPSAL